MPGLAKKASGSVDANRAMRISSQARLDLILGDLSFIEKAGTHWSFAYSALACFSTGMSGSAPFQMVRKS